MLPLLSLWLPKSSGNSSRSENAFRAVESKRFFVVITSFELSKSVFGLDLGLALTLNLSLGLVLVLVWV